MTERWRHRRSRRGGKDGSERTAERTARRKQELHKSIARALGVNDITDPSVRQVSLGLSRALDPVSFPGAISVGTFPTGGGFRRMPDTSQFFVFLGNLVVDGSVVRLESQARALEPRVRMQIMNMTPEEAHAHVRREGNNLYGATVVAVTGLPQGRSREYKGEIIGDFFRHGLRGQRLPQDPQRRRV
ncbi:MAG TPA: hypothetical protein VLF20_03685 [Patescibacteria group bacterium]|nr:hypothetical protein [Patescibacteria group bacterium]